MNRFKFSLKQRAAPFVLMIKIFCVTAAYSFYKFANPSFDHLAQHHMNMIGVKSVRHYIYEWQFRCFGRPTSKTEIEFMLVETPERLKRIEQDRTFQKTFKISFIEKNISLINPTIIDMIILTCRKLPVRSFSHEVIVPFGRRTSKFIVSVRRLLFPRVVRACVHIPTHCHTTKALLRDSPQQRV